MPSFPSQRPTLYLPYIFLLFFILLIKMVREIVIVVLYYIILVEKGVGRDFIFRDGTFKNPKSPFYR